MKNRKKGLQGSAVTGCLKKAPQSFKLFCFFKAIHDLDKPVASSEYWGYAMLDYVLEKD